MIKTNLDGMGCVLNEIDNALNVQGLFFLLGARIFLNSLTNKFIVSASAIQVFVLKDWLFSSS